MKEILLILLLQLIYVPFLTLRTIFLVKNSTRLATLFGSIEMLIYVFGLSLVFNGDQSLLAMIVYAVGFGLGISLGTKIEKYLAIGYIHITVNTNNRNDLLLNSIREKGFAITTYVAEGRDSTRFKYEILTKRNREKELISLIKQYESAPFIVTYEPKSFIGGYY